jgi:phospholipid/cholesterol/gamma-HCH transport system substrate-binding protein
MIKTSPTVRQIVAMALFTLCSFGAVLFLWLAFGGAIPLKPQAYRFDVVFPEATTLAEQADVRISGVPVGKVVRVEGSGGNGARATLEMADRAPVAKDTRAILRIKPRGGETSVEPTPGDPAKGTLPEGATLKASAVAPTVELDEIMRTFDPETRADFQTWMQSQAQAMEGRGADVNTTFGLFPGWVDELTDVLATLDTQSAAVRRTIATTGEVFDAISEREGDLRGLVGASERLFSTTAARDEQLAAIFRELPRFERESRAFLPELTKLANAGRPVVRQLQPAADEMAPTFAALAELSPQLDGFFSKLDEVVTASEDGLPAFERVLGELPPVLEAFQPWLRNVDPMAGYLGQHKREITSFLANATAASLARDLPDTFERPDDRDPTLGTAIHYLRTSQTLSPEALAPYPRPLGSSRANAYQAPGAGDRLASGLPVLSPELCANGDVAPPASAIPETLTPLIRQYAFRTEGRDVARPGCAPQGAFPGFGTTFPQLRAEP